MPFVTDRKAAEIPTLKNLDETDRAQALADAERVYRYVRRNEWIEEPELRAYGERNDLDPDRMNAALEILEHSGRLVRIAGGDA